MNCFDHHTHTAVCICRSCGKGLCNECAHHQYNHGYYCSQLCFEKLVAVDELNENAIRLYKRNQSTIMNVAIIQRLVFVFLAALGGTILASNFHDSLFSTINLMAITFIIFSIILLLVSIYRRR